MIGTGSVSFFSTSLRGLSDISQSFTKQMITEKLFKEIVANAKHGDGSLVEQYFDQLFEYYINSGEMPYGVAKARTGDPFQWIFDQLCIADD